MGMLTAALALTVGLLVNARPMRVLFLSVGGEHNCAILETRETKCWGNNKNGHLGYEDKIPRGKAPGEMGENLPVINFGTGEIARALATGEDHNCALLESGATKCWGSGQSGSLGTGNTNEYGALPGEMGDDLPYLNLGTDLVSEELISGAHHTCALLDDRKVKCWGANGQGQLGIGNAKNVGDEPGQMGDVLPFVLLGTGLTVHYITAGTYHTCCLLDDNSLKCFGSNNMGQVAAGKDEAGNPISQEGIRPGDMGDNLERMPLGTGRTVKKVAAGYFHTCAILDNDELKCWGLNNDGQLGQERSVFFVGKNPDNTDMGDNLPAVNLGTGLYAVEVSCGSQFTCALLNTGQVKCWGLGHDGERGDETNTKAIGKAAGEMGDALKFVDLGQGRTAKFIQSGAHHSCVILEDDTVKCWGKNHNGALGLEDEEFRGNAPGTMGDALPIVNLGTMADETTTSSTTLTTTTDAPTTTLTTTSVIVDAPTTTLAAATTQAVNPTLSADTTTAAAVDKTPITVQATDKDPRLDLTVDAYPPQCPVRVRSVAPGKWAEQNGMAMGDTLKAVNGKDVCNMTKDEFLKAMQSRPVNMTFDPCGGGPDCQVDGPELPVDKEPVTVSATDNDPRLDFTVDGYPPQCPVRVRSTAPGRWADSRGMAMGDTLQLVNGKDVCNMTPDEFLKAMQSRPVNMTLVPCGGGPECEVDGPAFPVDPPLSASATDDDPTLDFTVDGYPPQCPVRVRSAAPGKWADRNGMAMGDTLGTINGKDVCNMTKDEFLKALQSRPVNLTYSSCGDGPECQMDGPALPVDKQDEPLVTVNATDDDPRLDFTVDGYPPKCPIRVRSTATGKWADKSGLAMGDTLRFVNGKDVCDMTQDEFLKAMQSRPVNVTFKPCGGGPDCQIDGPAYPVDPPLTANATDDDPRLDFTVDGYPPQCPVRVSSVAPGKWADRSGMSMGDTLRTINGKDVCNMTKDEFLKALQSRPVNVTFDPCGGGPECQMDGPFLPVDKPLVTVNATDDDPRLDFTVDGYPPQCPIRVRSTAPGKWATRSGLAMGDTLRFVNGKDVCNMTQDEFLKAMQTRPVNVTFEPCGGGPDCQVDGPAYPVDPPLTANATDDDPRLDFTVDGYPPQCPVRIRSVAPGKWANRNSMAMGDTLRSINGKDVCNMTKDEFLKALQSRPVNVTFDPCGGGPECQVDGPELPVDKQLVTVNATDDDPRLDFTVDGYPPQCPIRVRSTAPGKWANRRGLAMGDTLRFVNGKDVCNMTQDEFLKAMQTRPVNVTFEPCGGGPDCQVDGPAYPVDPPLTANATDDYPRLDFTVDGYPPQCPVRIRSVSPGKWADKNSMSMGDTLRSINGKDVCNMTKDEFLKALQSRPVNVTFDPCGGGPECQVTGPAFPVDKEDLVTVNATEDDPRLDFTVDGYPPQCPVRVRSVAPGKWANRSGLAMGDTVRFVNGKDVCDMTQDEFLKAMQSRPVNVTFKPCGGGPECQVDGPAYPVDPPLTANATDDDPRLDFTVDGYPPQCPVRVRSVAPGKWADRNRMAMGDTLRSINGKDVCNMTKEEFLKALQSRPVNVTFDPCGGGPECQLDGPGLPVDKELVTVNATEDDPRLDFTVDGYPPQCPIRVRSTAPGKWANRSGLAMGDTLRFVNGKDVCDMTQDEFLKAMQSRPVNVTFEPCGGGPDCQVDGPAYPVDPPITVNATDDDPRLDFTVDGYPPQCPIRVRSVAPGKWADKNAMAMGDTLRAVNGKDVCNMTKDEFLKALQSRPVNVTFDPCGGGPECQVDGPAFPVDKDDLVTVNATDDDPRLDFTVDGYPPQCPIRVRSVASGKWADRNSMAMGDTLKQINGKDVCNMTKDEFLKALQSRPVNVTFDPCGGGPECQVDGPAFPVDKEDLVTVNATDDDPRLDFTVDGYPPQCPIRVRSTASGKWANRSGLAMGDTLRFVNGKDVCNMTQDEFLKAMQSRPVNVTFKPCGGGPDCQVDGPAYPVDPPITVNATDDDPRLDFTVDGYPPQCPIRVRSVAPGKWADRNTMAMGDTLRAVNGKDVCNMTKDEFLKALQSRPVNVTFDPCGGGPECQVDGPALPVDKDLVTVNATEDDPRLDFTVDGYPPQCPIRVRSTASGKWASRKGLAMGDTLRFVNGKDVCDMTQDEFLKAMQSRPVNVTFEPCGGGPDCQVDGPAYPVDPPITINATDDDPRLDFTVDGYPPKCPIRVRSVAPGKWADRNTMAMGDTLRAVNGKDVCKMTKDEFLKALQSRPVNVTFDPCGGGPECQVDGPALPVDKNLVTVNATEDDPRLDFTVDGYPPQCPIRVRSTAPGKWADQKGLAMGDTVRFVNGKDVCDMTQDEFLKAMWSRPVNVTFEPCGGGPDCQVDGPAYPVDPPITVNATDDDPRLDFTVDGYPPQCPVRVRSTAPGKWANSRGLAMGDTLRFVNGKDVCNMTQDEFLKAMQSRPVNVTFEPCGGGPDCQVDGPAYPVDPPITINATDDDPRLDFTVDGYPPQCPIRVRSATPGKWADRNSLGMGDTLRLVNGKDVCNMTKDEFLKALQSRPVNVTFDPCIGGPECVIDGPALPVDKQLVTVNATDEDPRLDFTVDGYPPKCPIRVRSAAPGKWANRRGLAMGDTLRYVNGKDVCDMTQDEFLKAMQSRPVNVTFEPCGGGPECKVDGPAYPVDPPLKANATDDDPRLDFTVDGYPPQCPVRVRSVAPGKWADRNSMAMGDTLRTVNGKDVCSMTADEFLKAMQSRPLNVTFDPCGGGPECQLDGPALPVDKQLVTVNATDDDPRLDFTVDGYPPKCPIRVRSTAPGKWADRKSLAMGDTLRYVNGKDICDMTQDEFLKAMQSRPVNVSFEPCGGGPDCQVDGPAYPVDPPLTANATDDDPRLDFTVDGYPPQCPVRVRSATPGKWADKNSLAMGDTLRTVNGKDICTMTTDEFLKAMQSRPVNVSFDPCGGGPECQLDGPGLPVDKQLVTVNATDDDPRLDFTVNSYPPQCPIRVRSASPGKWADRKTLAVGDTLRYVNGKDVCDMTPDEFLKAMQSRPVNVTFEPCGGGPDCQVDGPFLPVDPPLKANATDDDPRLDFTVDGYPPQCPVRVRTAAAGKWADRKGLSMGDTLRTVNGKDVCSMTKEEFLKAMQSRPVNTTFDPCGGGPECQIDGPAYPVDKPLITVNATDDDPRLDFTVDGYPPQCPVRVRGVAPGKWAGNSGLAVGDTLRYVNGKDVCDMTQDEFLKALQSRPVNVTFEQCGGGPECQVDGPAFPVDPPITVNATDDDPRLEFTVDGYPPQCPVRVRSTFPGRWAAGKGMAMGDTLRAVNGKDVCNMTKDEFLKAMQSRPVNVTYDPCIGGPECQVDGPAYPVDKPLVTVNATDDDPRLDFNVDGFPPDCPVRVSNVQAGKWADSSGMAMGDTLRYVNGKDICDMTKDEILKALQSRPVNVSFEPCGGGPDCQVDQPGFPVDKLTANATQDDPLLGFSVDKLPPTCPVRVAAVDKGSWAERSGIEMGDELRTINGRDVCNMTKDEFLGLLQDTRNLSLTLNDCGGGPDCAMDGPAYPVDKQLYSVNATVDDPLLGFTVNDYPPSCPVKVTNVTSGLWANASGVAEGDELLMVNGKSVCNMTPDEFLGLLQDTRPVNLTFKQCVGPRETCAVPPPDYPVDKDLFTLNATDSDPTLDFFVTAYPPSTPVRVAKVDKPSWGDDLGLKEGDTIVSINGRDVADLSPVEFLQALQSRPVNVTFARCWVSCDMPDEPALPVDRIPPELVDAIAGDNDPKLGFSISKLPVDVPPGPVLVSEVAPGSWAEKAGAQLGDELVAINGMPVADMTPEEMEKLLQDTRPLTITFGHCRNDPLCPPGSLNKTFPVDKGELYVANLTDKSNLGIALTGPPPNDVRVRDVEALSWAEQSAGVVIGDWLVSINGLDVAGLTPEEFDEQINTRPLSVVFRRDTMYPPTTTTTTTIPLDYINATFEDVRLGLEGGKANGGNYVISAVLPESWASDNGLRPGDEIVAINGRLVSDMTPAEVEELLQTIRPLNLAVRARKTTTTTTAPWGTGGDAGDGVFTVNATLADTQLGISPSTKTNAGDPVRLEVVESGMWADRSGLALGDEILTINGQPVSAMSNDEVLTMLQVIRPLFVQVKRVPATTSTYEAGLPTTSTQDNSMYSAVADDDDPELGFQPGAMPPDAITINKVEPGSWAAVEAGVRAGDVLVSINGRDASSLETTELLSLLANTRPLSLVFRRGAITTTSRQGSGGGGAWPWGPSTSGISAEVALDSAPPRSTWATPSLAVLLAAVWSCW